jgi:type IV secretory pathway VirB2 component (pilin)
VKISQLRQFALVSIGLCIVALLCIAYPTAGSATTTTSTINFGSTSGAITDFTHFLSGPVAGGIVVLSIIGGAVLFMQGQELSNGLKVVAVVAITIGMVAGATNYWTASTTSVIADGLSLSNGARISNDAATVLSKRDARVRQQLHGTR